MPPKSPPWRDERKAGVGRREVLAGLTAAALFLPTNSMGAAEAVSIGLNPLFLDSDIQVTGAAPNVPGGAAWAIRSTPEATDLPGDYSAAAFRAAGCGLGL